MQKTTFFRLLKKKFFKNLGGTKIYTMLLIYHYCIIYNLLIKY